MLRSILFSVLLINIQLAQAGVAMLASNVPSPLLEAKAYVLRDFNSGAVLASSEPSMRVEPASLTKVMTAYLTFEAVQQGRLALTQALPVSEKAWRAEGSKMFIEPNVPVTVDELLHGLIIQSGNDAAITLAENIAGNEEQFAFLMNEKARMLGMQHTHFMNATGLPHPEHYTTAYDLSILATALIKHFPQDYARLYSMKEYTYNKITQANRNRLLFQDPSVDGMKTGHTDTAGYCLIASAKRNDFRLVSVVLGTASEVARANESQKLLNFGYQFFESQRVYQKGQVITQTRIWQGDQPQLKLTVAESLYFTLPRGQYAKLKAHLQLAKPLVAPVTVNQVVAKLQFSLDGKVIRTVPVVAGNTVQKGNIFARLTDRIRMTLE